VLATVPAAPETSAFLHVRGSWSARSDRTASIVWLGILWVGMIAGFGVDFPRYLHENPAAPKITYLHGAIFTVWMLLLSAQVLLVVGDRVALHRKLGWFTAAWAGLMAVFGPLAVISSDVVNLNLPTGDPPFLSVNIVDVGSFIVLVAWGIALRKNPAAHRRIMILSTVALADPGFARFSELWPAPTSVVPWFSSVFYGNVILIVAMAVWDWWRGRMMRQFVIGASISMVSMFTASLLYFWPPWRAMTQSWVELWARHR
jgi:hypothetical protein